MKGGQRCCLVHHMCSSVRLCHRRAVCPVSVPPHPPSHLCPSATKHQQQGPNPPGSPNPGDYPASFPPLPSPWRSIVLHLELVIVALGDNGMNGYCRLGVARQRYPQLHWVISFLPFPCTSSNSVRTPPWSVISAWQRGSSGSQESLTQTTRGP